MDHLRPSLSLLSRSLRISPPRIPRPSASIGLGLGLLTAVPLSLATSPHPSFPLYIQSPDTEQPQTLRLIGLGVRTVSFLRVQVYNVGVYVEKEAVEGRGRVWDLEDWKNYESGHLLEAPSKFDSKPAVTTAEDPSQKRISKKGEALIESMLAPSQQISVALRIVPTRSTDFSHLRDGLHRALLGRVSTTRKAGSLDAATEDSIQDPLFAFRSLFPNISVPKGAPLTIHRRGRDGALVLEYGDKPAPGESAPPAKKGEEYRVLGALQGPGSEWVSRQMVLAYFADRNAISQAAKEAVAKGLEELRDLAIDALESTK